MMVYTALVAAVMCSIVAQTDAVAVMSIDLGAEFMKIAIVKPGVPMEIVLNKESSRKTAAIVAFRDGERQFANQAFTTAVRFPKKGFAYLTHIVGRHFDDPQVQLYRERFPFYDLIKDEERGTVLFRLEDGTIYSPEELIGMILESAREYAEEFADHPIKDAVITVPAYFNQAERRSIVAAANLVGLNVLQLMSDNAAVALNYGVFRRKNFNSTMQYYIFYDMGATSTVASVVGYQVVKMKDGTRMETNPQVVVKGIGFDRTLGGLDITLKLRDHLARTFNGQKKTKKDVFTDDRAMAKLLKEANRVKHVLSANADHYAQVEGLLDEKDFRAKVSREELEEMCKEYWPRIVKPIEDALKISEITMGEITEVILMGGGTRLPKVQEELQKFLGGKELGKSINTDESAAMGAVYQAAYLGKGFKVKTFSVKEGNIYPIVVEFDKHKTSDGGEETSKKVRRTLFGRMNPFPQKKVMTFNKHFSDFSFTVGYGDIDFLSEEDKESFRQAVLANVSLTGVADAYKKHEEGSEAKGIKAHFVMDGSGILYLDKVESVFEKIGAVEDEKDQSAWSKIGSAIGGLFGGSENKDGDSDVKSEEMDAVRGNDTKPEVPKAETEDDKDSKKESQDKSSKKEDKKTQKEDEKKDEKKTTEDEKPEEGTKEEKSEDKKDEKEKKSKDKDKNGKKDGKDKEKKDEKKEEEKKPKIVTTKEEIASAIDVLDLPDLSKDKVKAAKKRLAELKAKDREKVELEKAKNELEAYIFDMQDKLSQDLYVECSTVTEREDLSKQLSEASDWLYEQPDDAKRDVFTGKLKSLKDSLKEVVRRVYELEERPKALDALKSMLNHSEYFLKSVKNLSTTDDPIFTEVEVTTLEKLINETRDWRNSNVKEQKKLKSSETPKLLVEDIAVKIQALDREVKYLVNKAKYWKPKTKPKTEEKKANSTKINETKSDGNKTESTETDDKETEETKTEESEATGSSETPETQEDSPPESTDKDDKKEEEETLQIDGTETTDKKEHSEL